MGQRRFSRSGDYTVTASVPRDLKLELRRYAELYGLTLSNLVKKGLLLIAEILNYNEGEIILDLSGRKVRRRVYVTWVTAFPPPEELAHRVGDSNDERA